MNTRTHS